MALPERPAGLPVEGSAQPVPFPSGTPDGATTPAPAETDLKAELEAQRRQWELESQRNISRLQSTLMSQQAQQRQQWEQERADWENKLAESQMSHLEGEARTQYELNLYKQRNASYEQQLAETRAQSEAIQNMQNYAQWFVSLGVPYDKLDWSSPEALAQSGAMGLTEIQQSTKQELEALRAAQKAAPPAPVAPGLPPRTGAAPTPVVTQHGAVPNANLSFEDIRKSLSQQMGRELTPDDVFKLAERSPGVRAKLDELAQGMAEASALRRG